MKNKEDFLDEALKDVVRDSADDFFYIDDDGIIQSEYTIEEIRGMVSEEQNELYEQDKAASKNFSASSLVFKAKKRGMSRKQPTAKICFLPKKLL
jgi:hypothetical protein